MSDKDNDMIPVRRGLLAAACYIIRKSDHADSDTAKALQIAALGPAVATTEGENADYWRGRCVGFTEALRKTHTPEQLAEMEIV